MARPDQTLNPLTVGHARASQMSVEVVEYLDEPRVPLGFPTVIAGIGGLGKSTWAFRLAAATSRGETGLDKPAQVIIISAEDTWETTILPRLMAEDADLARVVRPVCWNSGGDLQLKLPDDVVTIETLINDVEAESGEKVRLIVMDPITAYYSGEISSGVDAELRSGLSTLMALIRKHRIALVAVTHLNKDTRQQAWARITGSGALFNLARSVMLFGTPPGARPDDPRRVLVHAKANLGLKAPAVQYRIETVPVSSTDADGLPITVTAIRLEEMDVVVDWTAEQIIGASPGRPTSPQRVEGRELIEELWRKHRGAVPVEKVYSAAVAQGFDVGDDGELTKGSEQLLRRAMNDLGGTARKPSFDGGWEWVPPDGFFPPLKVVE